jgi:carboxyl-terminal processing protease
VLEQVVDELYDPHSQLNTNTSKSWRLVPSGTDLWASGSGWPGGDHAGARELGRRALGRARWHVRAHPQWPDHRRTGRERGSAAPTRTPPRRRATGRSARCSPACTTFRAYSLAGGPRRRRRLRASSRCPRRINPFAATTDQPLGDPSGIGYILLNDSLGNDATVPAFDAALDALKTARGLIVDLRDTASGGNSSVARGILGRFVRAELPYQKHILPAEETETGVRRSWLELVSPRGERYARPVVVLVNRWTGSMGEGLAIGFDATGAGKVVGTEMARLVGATYTIPLPNTGIRANVPAERLQHVNGLPREQFRPAIYVDVENSAAGDDPFVLRALEELGAR